jgi:ERF superfamily
METSQTTKEIATALKKFQTAAPNVTKDAKANYGAYATLGNVIETVREPLAKHGLSYAQFPDGDGLTTILFHDSGEWIKATAALKLDKQTPQGQGSGITYMRRYALSAALGIATEDDDDGNEASTPRQTRPSTPTRAKPAAAAKDPVIELAANKERVLSLLKLHKVPCKTKKECEDSVFDLTGMTLEPDNFEQIAETLSAKLEAKETNQ